MQHIHILAASVMSSAASTISFGVVAMGLLDLLGKLLFGIVVGVVTGAIVHRMYRKL